MSAQNEERFYIVIIDPEGCFAIGQEGTYESVISKAISFVDKYDALKYIEKHGLQKISTIRKFKK